MSGRSAKERADGLVRCCRGGLSIGPEPTAERAGAVYFACDFPAAQVVIVQRHFASAIRAAEAAADAAGYARGIEEVEYVANGLVLRLLDTLDAARADLAAAVARAETAERMAETQREMLAFDATTGTVQRLRADLAAANARLAAAPSRDVPCVTCGHSIMVHQNNEAGGPCGQCDCEDGALLVNPPKL